MSNFFKWVNHAPKSEKKPVQGCRECGLIPSPGAVCLCVKDGKGNKLCLGCNRRFGASMSRCPVDDTQLVDLAANALRQPESLLNGEYQIDGTGSKSTHSTYYVGRRTCDNLAVVLKCYHAIDMDQDLLNVSERLKSIEFAGKPSLIDHRIDSKFGFIVVTQFVEGKLLTQKITEQQRLSVPLAAAIGYEAALILQKAHHHGLIHGNLKPESFILPQEDNPRSLNICGFSPLRVRDHSGRTCVYSEQLTQYLGFSPRYAPPEGPSSPSSDVYSLGCILYQCLTGKPPFAETEGVGLISKHWTDQLPPLQELHPELKEAKTVDKIIARATAKKPEQRYASMSEFASALAPLSFLS